MFEIQRHTRLFCLLGCLLAAMTACGRPDTAHESRVLVRLGEKIVTVDAYNQALEIAAAAYTHKDLSDPIVLKSVRMGVLSQVIEEMIIATVAETHHIRVSEPELDTAVNDVKADYPDQAFDRELLNGAVPFAVWREKLRMRLLTEKVARHVIGSKITLSEDEVRDFVDLHVSPDPQEDDEHEEESARIAAMVTWLRREKMEKEYERWLQDIRKEMPIEVNQTLWEALVHTDGRT